MRPLSGRLRHALAVSLCVSGVVSPIAAWAQFSTGSGVPGAGGIATGQRAGGAAEKPPIPEPDSVPGARARGPIAPATRAETEMAPNDALFDAINRGDIVSARDALSRGADLGAMNVLGMTPLELSVDLGRNDISFLLLSMRGEDSSRGSRAVTATTTQPARGRPAVRTGRAPAASPQAVAVIKPVAPPRLFANDGGAPLPNAGFLGFGSRQAAN